MSRTDPGHMPRPVPPYVVTGGRTHPSRPTLRLETLLTTLLDRSVPDNTTAEKRALLKLCRQQLGLAEAAAHLELPMSVVRVLASDLIDDGLLGVRDANPKLDLMERILAGLQKL